MKGSPVKFQNAHFSTTAGNLSVKEGIIEFCPDGTNQWVAVDFSTTSNFKDIASACRNVRECDKFTLILSAGDIICTGGSQSPKTAGSIIPNRRYVIATDVSLTQMM